LVVSSIADSRIGLAVEITGSSAWRCRGPPSSGSAGAGASARL
jgi:hypothetical protein